MDHVGAGHVHHHGLADRQDHRIVGRQAVFVLRVAGLFQILAAEHEGVERDVLVRIFVGPEPLVAGDLDMDVARRNLLLLEQDRQRERAEHDKDQDRQQGPGDFQRRVVGEAGGSGIGTAVEAQDHHRQKHHDQGDDAEAQDRQHVVEPLLLARDFGRSRLEADPVRMRRADDRQALNSVLGRDRTGKEGCKECGPEAGKSCRKAHVFFPCPAAAVLAASSTGPLGRAGCISRL